MITLAILALIIAPLVGWAIHRDIRRAVARRRWRRNIRALGAIATGAHLAAFGQSMAQALAAARQFEQAMQQVQVTITADTSGYVSALARAQVALDQLRADTIRLRWLAMLSRERLEALTWFDEYAETAWARYGWQRPTGEEGAR